MKSTNSSIFQTFLGRKRRAIELVTKVSLTIISTGPATAQAMLPFLVTRADEYTHVRELKVKGTDGTLPLTTRLVLKFKNGDSRERERERRGQQQHTMCLEAALWWRPSEFFSLRNLCRPSLPFPTSPPPPPPRPSPSHRRPDLLLQCGTEKTSVVEQCQLLSFIPSQSISFFLPS